MPFYLLKDEAIDPGLRRISREQIDVGLRDLANNSVPVHRKVHSLRIRCKKLRGVLRLFQPIMGEAFQIEDQRYRTAARALAVNRDIDVCAKTIASLTGSEDDLQVSRQEVPIDALERTRELLVECRHSIDCWPVKPRGFHDVAPGFARTYRKCLGAWEDVLRDGSDEHVHRLRRWAKYHWYHIRIFERLNKRELRKRRKALRNLQLTLGDAHDLVLLEAKLGRDVNSDPHLLQQASTRKRELCDKAINTGRKIFDLSVSQLVADLSGYWANGESRRRRS